jgi:hypothetical protein
VIVKVVVTDTDERVAVIVTDVCEVTVPVVTLNVALVEPAGTVTLAGTVAAASLSESVTAIPPEGAGPVKVTVPVVEEALVPVTVLGLRLTEATVGGLTVRVALADELPKVAPIVAAVAVVTAVVVIWNVAEVAPPATFTELGTVALVLLLESVTLTPPAGAAAVRVTVPVLPAPPVTDVGETVTLDTANPTTVRLALTVVPR